MQKVSDLIRLLDKLNKYFANCYLRGRPYVDPIRLLDRLIKYLADY
jgi:hypothetical protein